MKIIPLQHKDIYTIEGAETPEGLKIFKVSDDYIQIAENYEDICSLIDKPVLDEDNFWCFIACKAIPYPYTIYRNIYMLSRFNTAMVIERDGVWKVEDIIDFPFLSVKSTSCNTFDITTFEDKLKEAVKKSIEGFDDIILLLSEGKDSIPIAIALHDIGVKARCFTFAQMDSETHRYTESLAKELNHQYHLIDSKELESFSLTELFAVYEKLLFPTADFSSLIYVILYLKYNSDNSVVLDGSGSDLYLGYTINNKELIQYLTRKAGFDIIEYKRQGKLFNTYKTLFGIPSNEGDLLPDSTKKYFNNYIENLKKLSLNDKKLMTRGRQLVNNDLLNKARVFQISGLCEIKFPWLQEDLVKYIFNLENEEKLKGNINKVCVRKYLKFRLGEKANYILANKRSFKVFHPEINNPKIYKNIPDLIKYHNNNIKYRYLQITSSIKPKLG